MPVLITGAMWKNKAFTTMKAVKINAKAGIFQPIIAQPAPGTITKAFTR